MAMLLPTNSMVETGLAKQFCTATGNWARAGETLTATDRDTVKTRTISAKSSRCVIISDNSGFPISDEHLRIPSSLFKLHSHFFPHLPISLGLHLSFLPFQSF